MHPTVDTATTSVLPKSSLLLGIQLGSCAAYLRWKVDVLLSLFLPAPNRLRVGLLLLSVPQVCLILYGYFGSLVCDRVFGCGKLNGHGFLPFAQCYLILKRLRITSKV